MEQVYQVLYGDGSERRDNLAIVNRILYHGGQVKFLDRGVIVISAPDDVFASTTTATVISPKAHKRAQSILSATLKKARLTGDDKRTVCAVLKKFDLNVDVDDGL